MNYHLSPQTIKHKNTITTYGVRNSVPALEQAQIYDWVNS